MLGAARMQKGLVGENEAGRQRLAARSILGATVGNALEFYDFITYSFFAIQIGNALFPAHTQNGRLMLSLATFGVGFATRPIGGIVIGAYSDRVGRRAAMMLSFTMMGCAIIAIALIPPYSQIGIAAPILAIIARLVQGFSLGGEVGPTTAYLLESAPLKRRGLSVSWQGASQGIAATTAGLVGFFLAAILSTAALDAYGWRIAFLVGAITLPFGLWIRRSLPETLHDPDPQTAFVSRAESGLGAIRESWRIILLGLIVLASGTIATYVFDYLTTFAQNTLHMDPTIAFMATVLPNFFAVIAVLYGGWLSDRIGRRPVMIIPNIIFLVFIYPTFLWIVHERSASALLIGASALSLVSAIGTGAFYAALSETLPKRIRGGAFATIYATSIATFGGTTQLVVTWLITATGNPLAPAWYMLAATVAGTIAMMLILESAPARVAQAPAVV